MNAPNFLKIFFNNVWVALIILLICIGASLYYLFLPENAELTFFGYDLPFENSKAIPLFIFILGIFTNILINLFTGALQKEKSPETQVIVPPINIYPNPQPEIPKTANNTQEDQKFFPAQFFPDLRYFEGRVKLLNDLKRKLETEHRASIHDISGIGKTFSTYKFAEKFLNKYEKIFFVRANKEEMSGSLAEAGVWLNPSLESDPDQNKRALAFTDWLERNEKWLVIYDNVDLPEELKPFVPANLKGDCIFTSNFPEIENLGGLVTIEELTETESRRLLFSRSNNSPHQNPRFSDENESKAFEEIIKEIDGHPLALNTTGAYISKNVFNFQKFAKKLENEPNIIIENEDGFDKYQRKSVLKAFSIAIEDISEKKVGDKFKNSSTLAREILNAVSFTAPEDIPENLLRAIFEVLLLPRTFFQRLWNRLFGEQIVEQKKENLWQEIRLKLLSYDLLKYDKSLTKLTTHRLIQKVVQSKLSDNEQKEFLQTAVAAIDELFVYSDFDTIKENELYFSHAVAVIEKFEKFELSSEKIAEIYAKIGLHLRETIKYEEAKPYFEKSLEHFKRLPDDKKRNLSAYLTDFAKVFRLNGEYSSAEELCKQVLEIDKKTIGEEHRDYAVHLNNLGLVYESQGRYKEAIQLYQQALQILEKTIGKKHPDYATTLGNLANVYESQGRYDEAIELFEQSKDITENSEGKEHPNYANRLNNQAFVYESQGRYDKAIELFEQALQILEKTIGKKHPDYATCLNNLANVYQSQGRYDEAIELYKQALPLTEKTVGKEHPNYANRLNNLALVYDTQGKYNEALPMYEEALRICIKFLGENHPHTQLVKKNLEICKKKAEDSRN